MSVPNWMRLWATVMLGSGTIILDNLIKFPLYALGLRPLVFLVAVFIIAWGGASLYGAAIYEKGKRHG